METGQGGSAAVTSGKGLLSLTSGRWAGEQMLKALEAGRMFSPKDLRVNAVLRREDWKAVDGAVVTSAAIRLKGIADLRSLGLVRSIGGGLGKTVFEYDMIGDMQEAGVSMDGAVQTEDDRVGYETAGLPLPLIHKDWTLNLRTLEASRSNGQGLDVTQSQIAGRKLAEKEEEILFKGYDKTFSSLPIYGYETAPHRTKIPFGAATWSDAGVDGSEILTDVLDAIQALQDNGFYGPYGVYMPSGYSTKLESDYNSDSAKTIRQRILEIEGVSFATTAQMMSANKVIVVQLTSDVVEIVDFVPMQTVQWDILGGFRIVFKAFVGSVPLVKADIQNRSGIVILGEAP